MPTNNSKTVIVNTKFQLIFIDENPSNSIDVSQLSQGLYFVELIGDGKSNIEKLIVR